jgi:hypothetical protein
MGPIAWALTVYAGHDASATESDATWSGAENSFYLREAVGPG